MLSFFNYFAHFCLCLIANLFVCLFVHLVVCSVLRCFSEDIPSVPISFRRSPKTMNMYHLRNKLRIKTWRMPLPCLPPPLPLAWQLSLFRNLEAQNKQNFSRSSRVNYLVQPNENTTKLCLFGLSTKASLVKSHKGASLLTTLTKSITSCVSFFVTQTNLGSHQASHSALLVIIPVIQ